MSDDVASASLCELAALYSLGSLDDADSRRFEAHLLDGCGACDADVAANASVVALLGLAAEPAPPPPALRDRLLSETAPNSSEMELGNVGDWRPLESPGVSGRVLHVDSASRTIAMLVKAEPGARYPRHRHAAVEEMFMISGDLTIGDSPYGPGDYIRSEPASVHPPGKTLGGCMFLIRTSLDDETLPSPGSWEPLPTFER